MIKVIHGKVSNILEYIMMILMVIIEKLVIKKLINRS
jgi:hypothetical protein